MSRGLRLQCWRNMPTVVAVLAKEHGGPKIILQILFYLVTDF
jgi:hypothetical protein